MDFYMLQFTSTWSTIVPFKRTGFLRNGQWAKLEKEYLYIYMLKLHLKLELLLLFSFKTYGVTFKKSLLKLIHDFLNESYSLHPPFL